MDTRLNIFTKTKNKLSSYPLFLATVTSSNHRHYCLSLAWPNDKKIIIVQECRGLSWNLQTFYSRGEDKVIWAPCWINNNADESQSTISSWSSPRYDSSKKKRISEKHTKIFLEFLVFSWRKQIKEYKTKTRKTIYTGKLPTSKRRNGKSFWVFF